MTTVGLTWKILIKQRYWTEIILDVWLKSDYKYSIKTKCINVYKKSDNYYQILSYRSETKAYVLIMKIISDSLLLVLFAIIYDNRVCQ